MSNQNASQAADRKRLSSNAAYVKNKGEREHALLRLRPGSLAKLDSARALMGLSRSAYVESLLEGADSTPSTAPSSAPQPRPLSIGEQFEALFGCER